MKEAPPNVDETINPKCNQNLFHIRYTQQGDCFMYVVHRMFKVF